MKPGGADPQPQVSKWLAKVTVCTVSSGRTDRSYLWGCRGGSGEHYSLNTNSLSWVVFASHMLTSLRSARDRLDGVNKSQDLASVNYSLSLSHTHTHIHTHTHTHSHSHRFTHIFTTLTHTYTFIHTHTHIHIHTHIHTHTPVVSIQARFLGLMGSHHRAHSQGFELPKSIPLLGSYIQIFYSSVLSPLAQPHFHVQAMEVVHPRGPTPGSALGT